MNYQRTRYVGGPKAENPTTAQRADALKDRLAQLAQQRTEDRENLAWDRIGDDL
jgi:hypothetical protein